MNWTIPGTTLVCSKEDIPHISQQFGSMFMGGGMILSQVTAISGLETHTVQNWVRRGFLPPPIKKRYDQNQLCRILTINALRGVLPLEDICKLLGYINGQLSNKADDMIDDSLLYFMFVRLAAQIRLLLPDEDRNSIIDRELEAYSEPVPGTRQRVKTILGIMLTAYLAARMSQQAGDMLKNIKKENLV